MTKYQYQIIDVEETAVLPIVLNAFGEIGWALHHSLPDGGYLLEREIEPVIGDVRGDVHVHGAESAVEAWTEEEIRAALLASERHGRLNPDLVIPQTERNKYSAESWARFRGNGLVAALRGEL